jgi:hypothetical protein
MVTKVCSKCKVEKDISEFGKCKEGKYGVRGDCKVCMSLVSKVWRDARPGYGTEQSRKRRERFPEETKAYQKKYQQDNKEKIREVSKVWKTSNREHLKEWDRLRKQDPEISARLKEYYKKWYEENYEKKKPDYNYHCAKRRITRIRATPTWADQHKIKQIYIDCKLISEMTGIPHVVDHFYALHGKSVSGLHVENNLVIITKKENLEKSNKFVEDVFQ